MNLYDFIHRQINFSMRTFGPGERTEGVTKHIEKEVAEVRASGGKDIEEWIDIIILALDGAWRAGHLVQDIVPALEAKLQKNIKRQWPDWRTAKPGEPIEHVRLPSLTERILERPMNGGLPVRKHRP